MTKKDLLEAIEDMTTSLVKHCLEIRIMQDTF